MKCKKCTKKKNKKDEILVGSKIKKEQDKKNQPNNDFDNSLTEDNDKNKTMRESNSKMGGIWINTKLVLLS